MGGRPLPRPARPPGVVPAGAVRDGLAWSRVLPEADQRAAQEAIGNWPEYRVTPLPDLPALAARLGIAALACKDESGRFGRGGVKALGAPYALDRLAGEGRPEAVAATDGNHGLALAWAARRRGLACRIFVSPDVEGVRRDRLLSEGARIEVVAGTYDDAVEAAAAYGAGPGRVLVSDTDHQGGAVATALIMAGYTVLGREVAEQMDPGPTHVLLQCGVGGMAAGFVAGYAARAGRLPAVIAVEPASAACVQASLGAGAPVPVPGDLRTRMMGLSCGRVSVPAWEVLRSTLSHAVTIGEEVAEAMQAGLRSGAWGDAPMAAGDTGVAGLAALVELHGAGMLGAVGIGPGSRVLAVNSEGPVE